MRLTIKEKIPKVKNIKGAKKNLRIGFKRKFKRVKVKARSKNWETVPVKRKSLKRYKKTFWQT